MNFHRKIFTKLAITNEDTFYTLTLLASEVVLRQMVQSGGVCRLSFFNISPICLQPFYHFLLEFMPCACSLIEAW